MEELRNSEVCLPSFPEQQKIANCLSTLDELISAVGRKLEALETQKKGLMHQLFPRKGETNPRLRFPEFRDAGEWTAQPLSKLCDMRAGKFVSAAEISETVRDGLYPCFGGNGLRGYTRSFTHSGKYPLIGRQGALCGNINIVDGEFHATEHAVAVEANHQIQVDWLYYALVLLDLNRFATGQAQPGLSVELLNKLVCFYPNEKHEQQKIADCLSTLDETISTVGHKLEALKTHKKGLMQQLFPNITQVNG